VPCPSPSSAFPRRILGGPVTWGPGAVAWGGTTKRGGRSPLDYAGSVGVMENYMFF
jgi:hypothetical protein